MENNKNDVFVLNDNDKKIKEINIRINGVLKHEITINMNFSDLPFFCFENSDSLSSIDELNFNELKKCQENKANKYVVVFLGRFNNTSTTHTDLEKEFDEWHNQNLDVKVEITNTSDSVITLEGKMLKIFHKEYKPTANLSK